ncbi:MAG: hypothetical protein IPP90_22870 [Gemmatimonadaceae bacterium]|nr:hypothetical protein [Gemmatimonadaceae bacterium]
MSARHTLPRGTRVIERVRSAAAASMLIRSMLLGTLAIGVTAGGVMAGALVVAPVVARATRPDATAQVARLLGSVSSATMTVARIALEQVLEFKSDVRAALPVPVTRYAPPILAIVSIIGALSALFMRRTTPQRTLVPVTGDAPAASFSLSRLTPRSSARVGGKRHRTPRAVEALAATGASTTDIAWRTGLPIDAVQLLLAISSAPRQLQPPTA